MPDQHGQPNGRCPHHGWPFACEDCGFDTDARGFAHKGRGLVPFLPVRRCRGCECLCGPGVWNHESWWFCRMCVPLGETAPPEKDLLPA